MSAPAVANLLRRAGEWLVEPVHEPGGAHAAPVTPLPPPQYPLVGVVGLARRCGATTIARALATELASRAGGAAVVASPARPAVVALGSSGPATRLADALVGLADRRAAGRLCLASCGDAARLATLTRRVAPAVMEVQPGSAAVDAAHVLDHIVLVASPGLEPALAAAVAATIATAAPPPLLAVNRAQDEVSWRERGDVLVPEARMGARLALAGREPRGPLGRAIQELADLCERS